MKGVLQGCAAAALTLLYAVALWICWRASGDPQWLEEE